MSDAHDALRPAPAAPRPARERIGGVAFEDPFSWLEEDTPDTLAWQREHDRWAAGRLRDHDRFGTLRDELAEQLSTLSLGVPVRRGGRWFRSGRHAGRPAATVSEQPVGGERVLLDLAAMDDGPRRASLDWFEPSPDGRLVAYGISWGGDEESVLRIVDVDTGRHHAVRIPFAGNAQTAWLPDASGFFFTGGRAPARQDATKQLFFHRIGEPGAELQELPAALLPLEELDAPQVSADGGWVALVKGRHQPRIAAIARASERRWKPFLPGFTERLFGVFDGDRYVAVCSEGAPRGRLVSVPLATAEDRATWHELRPESDAVLVRVESVGATLVLSSRRDACSELAVLDRDGRLLDEVALPGRGSVLESAFTTTFQAAGPWLGRSVVPDETGFTFVFSSLSRSPSVLRYDVEQLRLHELTPARVVRDEELRVEHLSARTADGATARFTLVARADVDPSRPQPTLLYGYGHFNTAFVPGYLPELMPVIDRGGVVAFCHLRGGGEFGTDFWRDGRLERKQHTLDDLYAIAESLIASGRAAPGRLGLHGASGGGFNTAVALAQRPELWRAVVSCVGIYDLMKVDRDAFARVVCSDWGDPSDERQAPFVHAISPYHNVRERQAWPTTLVYMCDNDMRCPPWSARKLVARLLDAGASPDELLLRVRPDAGHFDAHGNPDVVAEWVGFLIRQLGLEEARA